MKVIRTELRRFRIETINRWNNGSFTKYIPDLNGDVLLPVDIVDYENDEERKRVHEAIKRRELFKAFMEDHDATI